MIPFWNAVSTFWRLMSYPPTVEAQAQTGFARIVLFPVGSVSRWLYFPKHYSARNNANKICHKLSRERYFSVETHRVLANQTVVVENGLIVEIGNAKKVKLPKDAVRIDGKRKYLVPGLVDMHTHLLSDSDEFPDSIGPDELRVMVANGVTTVRFMIGTPELLALRSRWANGEIEAPTIFVASPHLTGREQGNNFVVNTPEDAREAVRKSKAAGYDFIKVTTFIKPEVYEAAVDEAAKQNILVVRWTSEHAGLNCARS